MDFAELNTDVEAYVHGKTWYWYLPLWLLGLYAYYELFVFNMANNVMPVVLIIPYSFDFLLHELAHIFTAFLPPVLTASAGSGSELLLGLILIAMGLWQRTYFACLFACLWFDLACQSAGTYMQDAIPQRLPLVSLGAALSGGGEAKHDWNFVFSQLHILNASYFIGGAIRTVGALAGLAGIVFTAWLIYKMAQTPARQESTTAELPPTTPNNNPTPPRPATDDGFTSLPVTDTPPGSKPPKPSQST